MEVVAPPSCPQLLAKNHTEGVEMRWKMLLLYTLSAVFVRRARRTPMQECF